MIESPNRALFELANTWLFDTISSRRARLPRRPRAQPPIVPAVILKCPTETPPGAGRNFERFVVYGSIKPVHSTSIGNSVVQPSVNMVVGKTGRTTDLTQGLIRAVGVSVNVNYGPPGVAHFRDQFAVRRTSAGNFSAGGDSGSIVWQWKAGLPPVGLLFAGGGGTTFCNRMSRVVAALDIRLIELS
jgi:hypothetical protein